jgi:hypothetical protein
VHAVGRVRPRTADVSAEAFDVVVFLAAAVAKVETTGVPLPWQLTKFYANKPPAKVFGLAARLGGPGRIRQSPYRVRLWFRFLLCIVTGSLDLIA